MAISRETTWDDGDFIAEYAERYDKDGLAEDLVKWYMDEIPYYKQYVYSYKIGEEGP